MSHFYLRDQKSKRKRVGICLRWRSEACADVAKAIDDSKLTRFSENVWQVVIHEYNPRFPGQVMLQVWAQGLMDLRKYRQRHNVFYLWVKENEDWCCEGDLGRGLA